MRHNYKHGQRPRTWAGEDSTTIEIIPEGGMWFIGDDPVSEATMRAFDIAHKGWRLAAGLELKIEFSYSGYYEPEDGPTYACGGTPASEEEERTVERLSLYVDGTDYPIQPHEINRIEAEHRATIEQAIGKVEIDRDFSDDRDHGEDYS